MMITHTSTVETHNYTIVITVTVLCDHVQTYSNNVDRYCLLRIIQGTYPITGKFHMLNKKHPTIKCDQAYENRPCERKLH